MKSRRKMTPMKMTPETEQEMQAIKNTKTCNGGRRCPDGYSFWVCPFEDSKCHLVGLEDWENALAAKAREEEDEDEGIDG